jgi:hypothetical protein
MNVQGGEKNVQQKIEIIYSTAECRAAKGFSLESRTAAEGEDGLS